MIILVEDDPDQRLALRLALQAAGYRVREAANGHEALTLQRQRPPAVLITDVFMPDIDGFELIQTIRKGWPKTKIVVISGGGRQVKHDYLSSAELMGVDATLHKPFEIEALLQKLEELA